MQKATKAPSKLPPPSGLPSVFEYDDARAYLNAVLHAKKKRNPRFSIRAWSRQLGFNTPSYLAAALAGNRTLKPKLGQKISAALDLNDEEKKRFQLLVFRASLRGQETDSGLFTQLLGSARSSRPSKSLRNDQFRLIADWYALVLLEMVQLQGFSPDLKWMAARLGGKVPTLLIEQAVQRLLRLGLLRWNETQELVRGPEDPKAGDQDSSKAIREHHLQNLDRAREALLHQPLEHRDFRSSTLVLTPDNALRAREILKRAHREIQNLSGAGAGNEVFRFASQLFQVTESPRS